MLVRSPEIIDVRVTRFGQLLHLACFPTFWARDGQLVVS